ncbi:MAG: hypothetical protein Q4615_07815 [Paracoccus aminovorans]|nr:hypothetical protein [Paracoccus aminovorans]
MIHFRQGLVALLALGPVSAAWAVPATDEGAARLTGVLQTYLGATEGVVSVTPQGDSYQLKIDPAPLLAQVPDAQAQITVSPLTYALTDNGDGELGRQRGSGAQPGRWWCRRCSSRRAPPRCNPPAPGTRR